MVIDLTKKIKVVRPESAARFPYCNSLFIDDETRLIIDAGSGGRAYKSIPKSLIDILLLTHNHFDHTNGISFFRNAQVLASKEEAQGYSDPETYNSFMGLNRWPQLMGNIKLENFAQDMVMPEDIPVKSVGFYPVDLKGIIGDGEVFNLGKTSVTAIHTPGHTPGHYAFLIEKEGILFSGDIDISPRGPWYGGELSNLDDLIKSVNKINDLKPETLVTSHRRIFHRKQDNITKLLSDYIGFIFDKEEKILNHLSKPKTIDEIAYQAFIYDSSIKNAYMVFSAKMMIIKHLQRLKRLGAIYQSEDGYYFRT